jgi:hypothetical protein
LLGLGPGIRRLDLLEETKGNGAGERINRRGDRLFPAPRRPRASLKTTRTIAIGPSP